MSQGKMRVCEVFFNVILDYDLKKKNHKSWMTRMNLKKKMITKE